ncbi:uncharacterized protein DS421_3g75500 [Arachis hypogaea]|nr:uncharacterized protein DS421_3g75500 [Arachis hypogaea]
MVETRHANASSTILSVVIAPLVNESGPRNDDLPEMVSLNAIDACIDDVLPKTLSLKATPPSVLAVEENDLVTPQSIGDDAVDGKKSNATAAIAAATSPLKKQLGKSKSGRKIAWGKLLSQCS